jgi:Ca2+-binding EF-hand superfamily protein
MLSIFRDVDANNDGEINFSELLRYTRATDPAKRRLREKMLMALAKPRCSSSYREGHERELFRKADLNLNGHLDMTEVEALMRSSFQNIKKRDVHDLFQGIDRNHDGKLDFLEVLQYTTSKDPSTRRLREKLQTALSAPLVQASSDCGGPSVRATAGSSKPVSRRSTTSMHRSGSVTTAGSLIASS